MSAEPIPFPHGRHSRADWLDEIHARLLADVKQQDDYANNRVTSIPAYSEGAEHALATVRLQRHRLATTRRDVIRTIQDLAKLPDKTILMTSAQSVAQIQDDAEGHYLRYMGTEEADSLDRTDLFWNKASRHTLTLILPAVVINP